MEAKLKKTITVEESTFEMINQLSKLYGLKKYDLLRKMANYFFDRKVLLSSEFFAQEENEKKRGEQLYELDNKLEKMISKTMKKETNRVISFIRTQDKFLQDFKRHLFFQLSKGDEEQHPMFVHYDFILDYVNMYLELMGKDFESIYDEIKKREGLENAEYFSRSLRIIQSKTFVF